jgi:hypothetical protein
MHIEFLPPSPKAGLTEHVAREIGAGLIVAGFAREIPPEVFQVTTAPLEFFVHRALFADGFSSLCCRCNNAPCNGRIERYIGKPDAASIAQGFTARLCVHAKSAVVPEDVRAEYARLYKPQRAGWNSGTPGIMAEVSGNTARNGEPQYGVDGNGRPLK